MLFVKPKTNAIPLLINTMLFITINHNVAYICGANTTFVNSLIQKYLWTKIALCSLMSRA